MGFGVDAFVIASHALMVLVLGLMGIRMMRLLTINRPSGGWHLPAGITMTLIAFAIERIYYIAARLLKREGIDLWSAHPAPALLSAVVALAAYWLAPPYFRACGLSQAQLRRRVLFEIIGLSGVWLILAWMLH